MGKKKELALVAENTDWSEGGSKEASYTVGTPGGILAYVEYRGGKLSLVENEYGMRFMDARGNAAGKPDVSEADILVFAEKYARRQMPVRGKGGDSPFTLVHTQTFIKEDGKAYTVFTIKCPGGYEADVVGRFRGEMCIIGISSSPGDEVPEEIPEAEILAFAEEMEKAWNIGKAMAQ